MKQTRTALKVLTDRYRAVLLHCLAGLIVAVFPMTARSAGLDGSTCNGDDCTLTLSADKTIDGTANGTTVSSNQTVEGDGKNLTLNGKWTFSKNKEYTFSNIGTFTNETMKISGNMTIKDSGIDFNKYHPSSGSPIGTQIDTDGTLSLINVQGGIENIAGGGKLIVDAASKITITNALLVNTIENGGVITLDSSVQRINIGTNITLYNNTTNGTVIVKGGGGAAFEKTLINTLTVESGSTATFSTTSNLQSNTLTVNGSLIFSEENSSFDASGHSWSGSGVVQMANGMKILGNFGSVGVSLGGATASAEGNIATTGDFLMNGNVFDLGKRTITANTVKNGTINITLPAAGNMSSILNANVNTVTVSLDLSALKKKTVEKYILVADGKTLNDLLLNYDSGKYAISKTEFERKDAKNKADLNNVALTAGTVYIALKMGSGEQAVSDLIDGGEDVTPTDEKTGDIVDEIDDNTINDALDNADLKDKKNILREVGLDTSNTHIAVSTARTILDTVFARLANVSEQPRYNPYYENLLRNKAVSYKGRSGGDYVAGRASLWARGLVNKTKFDGEYAFDADSKGFAAGLEGSPAEDWKFGAGYAYTSTDVDSDRSKTDAETNAAFVYARYKPESFYFNAVGTFGHTKFKDETKILKLKSEYETDTFAAQAVAGYDFGGISPEVGVRYTSVKQDEYKTGLDLTVQSKTMEFATAVAGIRAGMTQYLRLNRKVAVHSEIKALATYDWMRDDEIRMVSLPDNSATYAMKGEPFARFGGEVGADVFFTFGRAGEIVLTYDGKFKKDYQDHTGMVSLKINF